MQYLDPRTQAELAPEVLRRVDDLTISLINRCRTAREGGVDRPFAAGLTRIGAVAVQCSKAIRRRSPDLPELRIAQATGGRVVHAIRERTAAPDSVEQAWLLALFLPDVEAIRWIDDLPVARRTGPAADDMTIASARPDGARPGEGLAVGLVRGSSVGIGLVLPCGRDHTLALCVLTG